MRIRVTGFNLTCFIFTVVLISGYASIAAGTVILAGLLVLTVVFVSYRTRYHSRSRGGTKHHSRSRGGKITSLDANEHAHLLEGKRLQYALVTNFTQ